MKSAAWLKKIASRREVAARPHPNGSGLTEGLMAKIRDEFSTDRELDELMKIGDCKLVGCILFGYSLVQNHIHHDPRRSRNDLTEKEQLESIARRQALYAELYA